MRRKAGIGGLKTNQQQAHKYRQVGTAAQEQELKVIQEQLESFKANLEVFAKNHRDDINKNPEFRKHFHEMCTKIGVDPLQSNKGFWAELLGFGSFYYEVGIQVIHVCMKTQKKNGGLIRMDEMTEELKKMRGSQAQEITKDDVERAVQSLKELKGGFGIVKLGNVHMIQSVPCELNTDHTAALIIAKKQGGWVSEDTLEQELGWKGERTQFVIQFLMEEGMVWVDKGGLGEEWGEREVRYWFPGVMEGLSSV